MSRSTCILPLFLLSLAACATVHPPPDPRDPVAVYVTDYGHHASLLLPREDGRYVEYAFGHWRWFAKDDTSALRGLLVLLIPGEATLGRRDLGEVSSATAASVVGAMSAQPLIVDDAAAHALVEQLDQKFESRIATRVMGPGDMEFVKLPEFYHGARNSNTTTAAWLRSLGATVSGPALLSHFDVADLRPRETPALPDGSPSAGPSPPDPPARSRSAG